MATKIRVCLPGFFLSYATCADLNSCKHTINFFHANFLLAVPMPRPSRSLSSLLQLEISPHFLVDPICQLNRVRDFAHDSR
jgi:hypothetical protein